MRLMVTLQEQEQDALVTLAQHERRDPRDQAALIIRADLVRRGLLPAEQPGAADLPREPQARPAEVTA